ncbi:hypothetical protein ACU4GD_31830 [Cupriavidus basilensis]
MYDKRTGLQHHSLGAVMSQVELKTHAGSHRGGPGPGHGIADGSSGQADAGCRANSTASSWV